MLGISGNPPSVLVVEDSPEAAAVIELALCRDYGVAVVATLEAARRRIRDDLPGLLILDLSLPDGDGLALCAELRGQPGTERLPVVVLSSHGESGRKAAAFAVGADDYITKPFDALELRARVERRMQQARTQQNASVLTVGELRIDTLRRRAVFADGVGLRLTTLEFELLRELAIRQGQVLSRRDLIRAVWNGTAVSTRTVDSHISNLRRKLNPVGHYLRAVRGIGYQLAPEKNDSLD